MSRAPVRSWTLVGPRRLRLFENGRSVALALVFVLVLTGLVTPASAVHSLTAREGGGIAPTGSDRGVAAVGSAVASLSGGHGPVLAAPGACRTTGNTAQCSSTADSRPAGAAGYGWKQVPPHPVGQGQGPVVMTYDTTDGYVVLLASSTGAASNNVSQSQTWRFVGPGWTQLHPLSTPVVCGGAAFADDPQDQGAVYFGSAGCSASADTWVFHAGNWTNVTTGVHPPGRTSASLVYDAGDSYVLLFGGAKPSGFSPYFNDTWAFAGGVWANLTASAGTPPAARSGAQIADDRADGAVILWGGIGSSWFNDTWSYSSGKWSSVTATGAPCKCWWFIESRTTYDAADGYVLLVGAGNGTLGAPAFTYRYSAGAWTRAVSTTPPVERFLPGLTYDAHDKEVVLFGGTSYGPGPGTFPQNDTWTYASGGWSSWDGPGPAARAGASLAFDAADGYVVLFGGWTVPFSGGQVAVNDTWKFLAGVWTKLSTPKAPSPRYAAGLVDDLSDGYLLLFGGTPTVSPYSALRDTWEFLNGSWTQLTPITPPPAQLAPPMVYDGADGYVLLSTVSPSGQTWTFHAGAWTDRTSSFGAPPGDPTNPLVYDAADGYVVSFGPSPPGLASPTNRTWSFLNGNWTNRTGTAGAPPPATSGAEVLYDPGSTSVVMFTGAGTTWTFSQGAWTQQFPSGPPPARTTAPSTYDGQDRVGLFVGGMNSTGATDPAYSQAICPGSQLRVCADTWEWTSGVPSALRLKSLTVSPDPVDLGSPVTVTATVTGGVVPYTFHYSGLPGGCSSQNQSTFSCTPNGTGTFTVTVTVDDATRNSTSGQAQLAVVAGPSISAFFASPSMIPVSGRTILSVNVSGGAAPLRFSYTGLPGGCASQTVPSLPCFPSVSGNFTVKVQATDANGLSTSATTPLVVTPKGASGGPIVSGFSILPAFVTLGNLSNLSVNASGGGAYRSYTYSGLPTGCVPANTSTLVCRPAASGVYGVVATVRGANGANVSVESNLTVYPVGGGASPSILAFVASPTAISLGDSTTLAVVARANGTVSYRYQDLPPGCTSSDSPNLPCTPTSTGTYTVQAIVSDSFGGEVGVFGVLDVVPSVVTPFAVTGFLAVPTNLTLGQTLYLVTTDAGAVGPVRYDYTGLPPGCASTNSSRLECVPTGIGNYSVAVELTDSVGRTARASEGVSVQPGVVPPGSRGGTTPFDLLNADGGAVVVVTGFVLGLGVAALATEAYRRRRLAEEGQALVREMTRGGPDDHDGDP